MEVVSKIMKDGSTASLTGMYGVLMREELTNDCHIITLTKKCKTENAVTQNNYIKEYWDMVIRDRSQPTKWILEEFFVYTENRFELGVHFTDWTFGINETGGIEKLVIESVYSPSSHMIEMYDVCIATKDGYLYEYFLQDIGKMIFSL